MSQSLEAKCSCGSVHFKITVPTDSLPLGVHLCHCSICRYSTGAPCVFHATLPEAVEPEFIAPSSLDNITSYTGEGMSSSSKFCSTCGCHIGAMDSDEHNWMLSPSIFSNVAPWTFLYKYHIFSKSSVDGGIAQMLLQQGDHTMGNWNPADDSLSAPVPECHVETDQDGHERLRAKCHCGGVSFTIPRPTQKVRDDPFTGKFVSPLDKDKWLACFDVCDDCRLVNGADLVGWTFFPLSICEPKIKPDLLLGTSKTYASSEGVLRSFCGTCGATLFYSNKGRHPDDERQIVDLSVSVLRAPEGSLAEQWLTWRPRLAWAMSGSQHNAHFVEELEKGMEAWTLDKNGKHLDLEIG